MVANHLTSTCSIKFWETKKITWKLIGFHIELHQILHSPVSANQPHWAKTKFCLTTQCSSTGYNEAGFTHAAATAGGLVHPCSPIQVQIRSELLPEFTTKDTQDPFQMRTLAAPEVCEQAPLRAGHTLLSCDLDGGKLASNSHKCESSLSQN